MAKKIKVKANPEFKDSELNKLEQVMQLMSKHNIAELDWETSNQRVHLKTPQACVGVPQNFVNSAPSAIYPASATQPVSAENPASDQKTAKIPGNHKQIQSPFVGTFYRSPSPEADAYVKEGQVVKKGNVLCIIEAMKLMNEIESDFDGKIISVLAENGQPVEFGEPLFLIETN